jgi:secreted trypsin-like serine protease
LEWYIYFVGDSGGPIHQWVGDHWIQVGIVSFGRKCAEADYPGVYTRLSFYHNWLYSNRNKTGTIIYGSILTISDDGTTNMIETNFFFLSIFSLITSVNWLH